MPPHCDSMDGPVVKVAMRALETQDLDLILPYVKHEGEEEVRTAFAKAVRARKVADARGVADLYFFETVVRVHRAGEGAPYTGLKPAGVSEGPVIPVAEEAIESGKAEKLIRALTEMVRDEVTRRLERVRELKIYAGGPVPKAREYVEAMLGLQVWSNKLYLAIKAGPHGENAPGHEEHKAA